MVKASATSFTVVNVGSAVAEASVVDVSDLGQFKVPPLKPGESATQDGLKCPEKPRLVTADAGGFVGELDEQNNTALVEELCPPPPGDTTGGAAAAQPPM